jgi:hypothetical protein
MNFMNVSGKNFQEQSILKPHTTSLRLSQSDRAPLCRDASKADAHTPNRRAFAPVAAINVATVKARRASVTKFLLGCTLGLSALSSQALTIDQVITDMSSNSEAMVIDPRYDWQSHPNITMYAPRGDAIPSWWTGNRPTWTYDVLTWFTAFEAQGNAATNTRVQIANLRFYYLSQSTRTWKQYDMKAAPAVDLWQYPFTWASSNSGVRNESSGGISVKPKYPNFHHGYGNPITINPQDVRAIFVAMEYRLVVDDPSKPDDRASAKYVVDSGGDYYPGNGQGDWSLGYAPGMGNGRMVLATKDWRTATLLVPNSYYGATMAEMKTNPPPLPADTTGTTTASTTTTTKAATTTTTKAATTTTASVTTTTVAGNTSSTSTTMTSYVPAVAKQSGKCMDVYAQSTADGTKIVQWSCNNGDNQKWALRDVGGAKYQVIAKNSGKCLTVPNSSTTNGTTLQQATCSTAANQLWTARAATSGYSQLVSVASGKCANVQGYSTADGAVVEQNACTASDSQYWSLPVSQSQTTTTAAATTTTAKATTTTAIATTTTAKATTTTVNTTTTTTAKSRRKWWRW